MSPEKRQGHHYGDWGQKGLSRGDDAEGKIGFNQVRMWEKGKGRGGIPDSIVCVKAEQWEKEQRFG